MNLFKDSLEVVLWQSRSVVGPNIITFKGIFSDRYGDTMEKSQIISKEPGKELCQLWLVSSTWYSDYFAIHFPSCPKTLINLWLHHEVEVSNFISNTTNLSSDKYIRTQHLTRLSIVFSATNVSSDRVCRKLFRILLTQKTCLFQIIFIKMKEVEKKLYFLSGCGSH